MEVSTGVRTGSRMLRQADSHLTQLNVRRPSFSHYQDGGQDAVRKYEAVSPNKYVIPDGSHSHPSATHLPGPKPAES